LEVFFQAVILSKDSTDERSGQEAESFAELVANHQARLHGYIRSLIGDAQASRDVLQETNMMLLRKERDFQQGTNFSAWALRVAYFEVLTWRRKMGRDRLVFDDETVERIAEQAEQMTLEEEQRRTALKICLEELPGRQRAVVQQLYFDDGSVAEIAEETGFKANAISQLLFRAKRNLAECVRKKLDAEAAETS
jgi:RNA polymerase sigma-70 factor (ECF subfamily)